MNWNRYQRPLRALLAAFFILAGVMHFLRPSFYMEIMPPYLPYHAELIYISGVCEILGGFGILIPAVRRPAGFGLIALLIAVFPANIYMATHNIENEGITLYSLLLLLRLPLQVVFIAWAYWCTKS